MSHSKKVNKVVVPAAGKGTRLLPLTKAIPKELIPLGRKPVLEHIVDEIAQSGLREVLFVISDEKESIRRHFAGRAGDVSFHYVIQPEQKGLADAIYCAKDFAGGEPFAVALGDSVIETDASVPPFRRVIDAYETTNASSVILMQECEPHEVVRYGIAKPKRGVGDVFEIEGLVEKPKPEDAPSRFAVAGRYVFAAEIFDFIERTPRGVGGEYQISDSIDLMIREGLEVWCAALLGKELRRDIGTFESYFEALLVQINREM